MSKSWYEVIGFVKQGRRYATFFATVQASSEKLAEKYAQNIYPNLKVQITTIKLLEEVT